MIKRNLLVMGLAVLLSACGFQLRGTGSNTLAIKELNVSARDAYGETVKLLKSTLQSGGVKVDDTAPYKLVLTSEKEDQRTASYSGSARSVDIELSTVVTYELRGATPDPLLSDKVEVEKDFTHDGNNLAGSDSESTEIRREMRRELVQRLILRLQQLTPARLAELQAQSDARAKAAADAEDAAKRAMDATPQQSPIDIPTK
ncbi:LPS assembly lipoprotein LptE [Pseudomonas sp. HR96]|uniref:LPS-assembly lipoprotein LptE n=1 Tax=Pseudomonas sp. HR96 TaxID=1027966 RepID=UPI002A74D4F2|nr:LPS assembly lipoprotein LptE [Pseudomonas sp. HR96]WPO99432.1 LPS assembly lipoprotein LptE [Pseudomonas sp. HR96]